MRWCSYTISAVGLLPWLLVLAVIWPPKAATAGGKKNNDLSGDLIPIPDHLKDQYNNRHLVDELNSGDIDYDEYIDLELEKHKSKEKDVCFALCKNTHFATNLHFFCPFDENILQIGVTDFVQFVICLKSRLSSS